MALESESESAAALLLARLTGAAPFERRSGTRARGNDTATQDEDALAKQTARTFYAGQRINLGICLISSPAREIETGRRLRLMSRIGPTARPYRLHSFTRRDVSLVRNALTNRQLSAVLRPARSSVIRTGFSPAASHRNRLLKSATRLFQRLTTETYPRYVARLRHGDEFRLFTLASER